MIFHENHLLADDFHEISYLIFVEKKGKMLQNMLSAAGVIGALRIKGESELPPVSSPKLEKGHNSRESLLISVDSLSCVYIFLQAGYAIGSL